MSSNLQAWVLASRPKTLFAAVAPVMLGTALAFSNDAHDFPAALAALIGALCIQIATNLANDYWDARKGADTAERLGPVRVTSAGLLKPRTVFAGMLLAFFVAACAGLFLVARAGWPVLVIGVLSIACGILYTAGPFPLAYVGLGDVFTFVFFGLVATGGTYFVQALQLSPLALLLGSVPGFYSVVLIALNNLRDRESDVLACKRTLAVRFGPAFARAEIAICLFAPAAVAILLGLQGIFTWWMAIVSFVVAVFFGWRVVAPLHDIRDMREINALLPRTGLASILMATLLSVLLVLPK